MSERLNGQQVREPTVETSVVVQVPPGRAAFRAHGIETLSGRLTAGEATIQVLLLPVLILGWGLVVTLIVAFTR